MAMTVCEMVVLFFPEDSELRTLQTWPEYYVKFSYSSP